MSLIPYLLNELEDLAHPSLYDQHFGLSYPGHDLFNLTNAPRVLSVPLRSGYVRPWRHVGENESGVSNLSLDKQGLKVCFLYQYLYIKNLHYFVIKHCADL